MVYKQSNQLFTYEKSASLEEVDGGERIHRAGGDVGRGASADIPIRVVGLYNPRPLPLARAWPGVRGVVGSRTPRNPSNLCAVRVASQWCSKQNVGHNLWVAMLLAWLERDAQNKQTAHTRLAGQGHGEEGGGVLCS